METNTLVHVAKQRSAEYASALCLMLKGKSPNAFLGIISNEELEDLRRIDLRQKMRSRQALHLARKRAEDMLKREFFLGAVRRKEIKALRREIGITSNRFNRWLNHNTSESTIDHIMLGSKETLHECLRNIGRYWHDLATAHVLGRQNPHGKFIKPSLPPTEALPLYACSGELEANLMNTNRICKMSRGKAQVMRCTAQWKYSDKFIFTRDGGGQAETQFLITPQFTKLVCGLVDEIGPMSRNGGHIHINCKGDEAIGERVFNAMRYHLSWTRWLVGSVRRNHTWAPVGGTQSTFRRAIGYKQAAVAANTWNRTGTIEMRLWGTTSKASEWLGRRDLMQAIARWSESNRSMDIDGNPLPITRSVGSIAWVQFFTWASSNAPEGLAYALKTIRRKARASRRNLDQSVCSEMLLAFEQSGLTCRGYRRRQPVSR
jgi:hypothetical protein